jgi:ADP-heptose:LPS heptosyltransferase
MKVYSIVFKILKLIHTIFLYFGDCSTAVRSHSQKAVNKILIIRLDAIGDFIFWLDSAQHFRKIYPDKKIILLGNKAWTELAKTFSYWDEVWELDRNKFCRNIAYRFHLLKKVRTAGFDVVVQPTYSREFLYGDAIVRISGAREKIGSVGDYSNILPIEKKLSARFYTQLIRTTPHPLMELKRNAEFMCELGISMTAGVPDLSPAIKEVKNPLDIRNYYVLFPGASWSGKQWPITCFAVLADKIYRQHGLIAVICGNSAEQALAEALVSHINVPVMNMTGKTTLINLTVIIKDALFLVGNDTGAIHFAAAVSTPSCCILGGGHYGRFMPYDIESKTEKPLPVAIIHQMDCFGCNWRCRYFIKGNEPAPCIEKISVEEVFAALQPLIKKTASTGFYPIKTAIKSFV